MKRSYKDSYSHVLKYTGIFGGVQGVNILISLVRNKIVAMLLGPSGMGMASLFNTVVAFVSQTTNLGISFSAVKQLSEAYDKGDDAAILRYVQVVRSWSLMTAFFGILVCVALGPLLNAFAFNWGDHTLHFILLAPAVGLLAITGGETAILKGLRQLRSLAMIQVYNVFAVFFISVPLYYFFGHSGIVPVIVLMALSAMLLTVHHSLRLYPLRFGHICQSLRGGMPMVRLGVAFVLAGVMGSGAELLIRSYLNVYGSLNVVGLYNAGFMLTITYAGMVFSAMETDYFPRLSAVGPHRRAMCETVNRQIEVSLLIVSPMLCLLMVGMPYLIPLLFTSEFEPVVGMAQVAVFSMYVKSVSLPISYLTLARGDSMAYLLTEAIDDVLLVVFMIAGYQWWGLWGTGVALSASYVVDFLIIYFYTYVKYGYRMSLPVIRYAGVQLPLGIAAYVVMTWVDNPYVSLSLCLFICSLSLAFSLAVLRQKTTLWSKLKQRLTKIAKER